MGLLESLPGAVTGLLPRYCLSQNQAGKTAGEQLNEPL